MNFKRYLFLLFIILSVFDITYANIKIPIEMVKIYDGDTIFAKIENNTFPVRLIGIYCYETGKINRAYKQAYENNISIDSVIYLGNQSKMYLQDLYKNNKSKKIFLEFKGLDKYGRVLGIIYFNDINVNEELLKKGSCFIYNYKK